jgi:uncharacterized protein
MRKMILVFILLFSLQKTFAQTPANNEHVKKLLELTGSGKIGVQIIQTMISSYKKEMPTVPAEYWDNFMKEVNADTLIDMIVPVYKKYYSDEDITALITFYESPVGQKVVKSMPLITQEAYALGRDWGQELTKKIIQDIIAKGYSKEQ